MLFVIARSINVARKENNKPTHGNIKETHLWNMNMARKYLIRTRMGTGKSNAKETFLLAQLFPLPALFTMRIISAYYPSQLSRYVFAHFNGI